MGARENYSIPYSLYSGNELALMITDAWADSLLPWRAIPGSRAAERFDPKIPSRLVRSFDWSLLAFEVAARSRVSGWTRTIARNNWFQKNILKTLQAFKRRHPREPCTLYSYSYTARLPFEFAKQSGWSTVLGQIDPGPFEERIVTELNQRTRVSLPPHVAPADYWDTWRDECRLADRIIVNSHWAFNGLSAEGIPKDKLRVVPLVYDPPPDAATFVRTYPSAYNHSRPLRILFLGQVNLRKGAAEVLGAMSMLESHPVEVWMVGPVQIDVPETLRTHPKIRWIGTVPRSTVNSYYRDADVFLFPTYSDGFGLTQLEAQAWKLPVIASKNCGDVVRHLENGFILPEVSAASIAAVIQQILSSPDVLPRMAGRSHAPQFTTAQLASRLGTLLEK